MLEGTIRKALTTVKAVFFHEIDKVVGKRLAVCCASSNIREDWLSGREIV